MDRRAFYTDQYSKYRSAAEIEYVLGEAEKYADNFPKLPPFAREAVITLAGSCMLDFGDERNVLRKAINTVIAPWYPGAR